MQKRKGAKSIKEIDPKILKQLNLGKIESANLVEALAINFDQLLKSVEIKAKKIEANGITSKMKEAAIYMDNWQKFATHNSDTIRGIAAYNLANHADLPFAKKLDAMKIFAGDSHFGVREWAWIALRNQVIENLDQAISLLEKWSLDKDENIRRFSSEITRPRGVWCAHITELKTNPQKCLKILENLKSDSSKYVQSSIGNWLNDATKSNEIWVKNLTKNWLENSESKETSYIVRRALRNLS